MQPPEFLKTRPRYPNTHNEVDHAAGDNVYIISHKDDEILGPYEIKEVSEFCPCCPGHNIPGPYYIFDESKTVGNIKDVGQDWAFSTKLLAEQYLESIAQYNIDRDNWDNSITPSQQEELIAWQNYRKEQSDKRLQELKNARKEAKLLSRLNNDGSQK